VAGFTGASLGENAITLSFATVLLFGLANLLADAVSMGLGNFLSVRADQRAYAFQRDQVRSEIVSEREVMKDKTRVALVAQGLPSEEANELTELYSRNTELWLDYWMDNQLGLTDPSQDKSAITSTVTFLSFVVFGFIPLVPYAFLVQDIEARFISAISFAIGAIILLGLLRWRVTSEKLLNVLVEMLAVGVVAGSVAYAVGTFFR
jgi:VIT1/CCC1 family predicted Fe2+/Mn2+ transporter